MKHTSIHTPHHRDGSLLGWVCILMLLGSTAACSSSGSVSEAAQEPSPRTEPLPSPPHQPAPVQHQHTRQASSSTKATPQPPQGPPATTDAKENPPSTRPEPTAERSEAAAAIKPAALPLEWMEWVVTHCLIDELGPSDYAVEWMKWIRKERRSFSSFMPDDAPRPNLRPEPLPEPGSAEARAKAQQLRKAWLAQPASHVLECTTRIERRDCPECHPVHKRRGDRRAKYGMYLPKALLTNPDAVRSLLLLAPGGNGGRTRYFLTPIPNKHVTLHKRSGGLEVKRHADTFYATHPDHSESLIVSTDNGGWSKANGHIEYLSHDLPKHIADTFLGGRDHRTLALGVEGISRGSRALITALRQKPEAFHVVGLTCMHCGSEGGPVGGYEPDRDLADLDERRRWLSTLASRAERGLFHIRFAVGNADLQWTCNKRLHTHLVQGGVLDDRPPQYSNCRRTDPKSPRWCDTVWDSFHLYDRMPHHYALLKPSWIPQLNWHLDTLHTVVQTIHRSPHDERQDIRR